MLNTILANVNGSLTIQVCEVLAKHASKVPSSGAVLDLNCGEGRSTFVLAAALEARGKDTTVIAVDTHIRNPFSETPFQEGSVLRFLTAAQRLRLAHRIVPIVAPVDMAGRVVGKRCANLVVVQSPESVFTKFSEDALSASLEIAKEAVRKQGVIIVCCPNVTYQGDFAAVVNRHFSDNDFSRTTNLPDIKIFEVS
jgi:SAM-dependent methyltransferase